MSEKEPLGEIIALRLRKARKGMRLSLQEVADRAETTPQTIQRLETGKMTLTVEWVARICHALGVKVPDFFADEFRSSPSGLSVAAELAAIRNEIRKLRAAITTTAKSGEPYE